MVERVATLNSSVLSLEFVKTLIQTALPDSMHERFEHPLDVHYYIKRLEDILIAFGSLAFGRYDVPTGPPVQVPVP